MGIEEFVLFIRKSSFHAVHSGGEIFQTSRKELKWKVEPSQQLDYVFLGSKSVTINHTFLVFMDLAHHPLLREGCSRRV